MKMDKVEKFNFFDKFKSFFKKFKEDPVLVLKQTLTLIKNYIYFNRMFCLFVLGNLINGLLLRWFTLNSVDNFFDIWCLLADFTILLVFGAFGYFFKSKGRIGYWILMTFVLSALCLINSAYYTFYTSFSSVSLLSTTKFIVDVGDAVVENVLQPKDLIYLIFPFIYVYVHYKSKKANYYEVIEFDKKQKRRGLFTLASAGMCALVFCLSVTATDVSRLTKQWNREYIVSKFGIYIYHINDLVLSLEPKLSSLFGYDNALKTFNEYFALEQEEIKNKYTDIYKGKNIIGIHAESIQNFVIGLKFNGIEVTPNLNKLANGGMYFNNFYTQVSVGTSSDTEFTLNTSLMPAQNGTAFGNYFNREYISMPKLLGDLGYYTFAMHGNNGDYWNRRVMHKNLGYNDLYAKKDFEIDEVIGLGLSDVSFFTQAVEKLEKINEEHDNFYGTFISLTNHTPFSDLDKYGEFPVDLKEIAYDEETGEYIEISYPYMEDTKLGRYLKSVHYADYALGLFFELLEDKGLLENTVIVLYGDHDARLPQKDFVRLYNYDKENDDILDEEDPNYVPFGNYQYELNRKVPLIIWTKEGKEKGVQSNTMGMYDLMPTLGNMFGFTNKYALGHDIFDVKENNLVVFPTGNWVTNSGYYNNQKSQYFAINNSIISEEDLAKNNEYADSLLKVSNSIIVFDLIKNTKEQTIVDEKQVIKEGANE